MATFFVYPEDVRTGEALIRGSEARHLRKVLRLTAGEEVELLDGGGNIYQGTISEVGREQSRVSITRVTRDRPEPPFLHLTQALVKKRKMEFIIQKATELGVSSITPLISEYTSLNYKPASQLSRWQKIVQDACKQGRRPTPPKIHPITTLETIIGEQKFHDAKLILWEKESVRRFPNFPADSLPRNISLIVGPEGGFAAKEVQCCQEAGWQSVTLGPSILRAETAAIAALAVCQYLLGR